MAKDLNRAKGGVGEGIAARLLTDKGYQVIEMNYQTRHGEIDLICADGEVLVFVEVKLKVGEDYGTPEEMINFRKLAQVKRTAEYYLISNKEIGDYYEQKRIDAVTIVLDNSGEVERINHYENVEL